jgi:hypothetical protein
LSGVIRLEDRSAGDADFVGGKAAGLARARRAGLPVLPGWVVPAVALPTTPTSNAAARFPTFGVTQLFEVSLPAELGDALACVASFGERWIVRSSTSLDDDARWAGAFSSYLDVGSTLLPTAVRGCWASLVMPNAIDRAAAVGIDLGRVRLAILIQPWRDFSCGGVARVSTEGDVDVIADARPPHELLRGDASRAGAVPATRAVEHLARAVWGVFGATVLEWGASGDDVTLLQVRRDAPAPTPHPAGPARRAGAREVALARIVTRYPAPLGDELVVPWALGVSRPPRPVSVRTVDPADAVAEAEVLARRLAAALWRTTPDAALTQAASAARLLLAGYAPRLPDLADEFVEADASRVVGLIDGVGVTLASSGLLTHPSEVWRLSRRELLDAISSRSSPPVRTAVTRWEPFVADIVRSAGVQRRGLSVVPGVGTGALHPIRLVRDAPPRAVLAVAAPLPHLAPLLWRASALVVARGNRAAHLFEVARSLGVPAVSGVDLTGERPSLVAVDGWRGDVHFLPEPATRSVRTAVLATEGG